MDPGCGQGGELRTPAAHIVALGVEALALAHGVEDPEVGGCVRPAACGPLPAQGVGGQVRVHQGVPEPPGPGLPGQAHLLGQQGRDHHAHPVVHPTRLPQLAHPGVDQGDAGAPGLPGGEQGLGPVGAPGEGGEAWVQGFLRGVWVVVEQVVGELPPAELPHKGLRGPG